MRNYVIINGVNSLTIQGLAINNLPPITKPMIRTQREEIDGRDGDIVTELGYSAYDKQMEIGLYGNFDIDAIIKYFTGEGTIVFSNEEDKYYNFKILDQIDYEKLLKFKTATITFHCQPFKYPVEETPIEGEAITITGSGSNITLENTIVAPMEMKVKGNTSQTGTPTPSSPIPVQVVSGDNSIEVVGKNLLDSSTFLAGSYQGIDTTTRLHTGQALLLESNTYTLSTNLDMSTYKFYIVTGSTQVPFQTAKYNSGWVTNQQYSFTLGDSNKGYFCLCIGKVNGETLTVDDIKDYHFQLEKGNQPTTYEAYKSASYPISLSSKNLCHIDNFGTTLSGLTITASDNTIILNGTNTQAISANSTFWHNIKFTAKEESKYKTTLTQTVTGMAFGYYLNGSGSLIGYDTTLQPGEYTLGIYIPTGTYSNFKIKIQIEKGTTATDYVDYYDYGELCKIGTYQDKIDKSTGKNLFNPNIEINSTYNSSIATALSNFKSTGKYATGYTSNGTSLSNNANYVTSFTPCQSGVTYTINNTYSAGANFSMVCFLDDNGNVINHNSGWSNNAYTHTATSEEKYIMCGINMNDSGVDYRNWVMINEGETALPYEPYGTGWYLKKEIGKVVLNGSEMWNLRADISYSDIAVFRDNDYVAGSVISNSLSVCNYFTPLTSQQNAVGLRLVDADNYGYQVQVPKTIASTSAEFQTWITNHNLIIYHPLQTSTYETITDTTLIGQLEALKPYSYNPTTNITQTNNDAPFELDVSLSYTNTMNVNNVGNIYAKPILTIEGSGTIGIILNDIEVLSVDLGTDEKITIDVPNLQAYNPDDNVLLNRNVTGDYMKLLINDGDNTIAFSGSVTSATLTSYTRWI